MWDKRISDEFSNCFMENPRENTGNIFFELERFNKGIIQIPIEKIKNDELENKIFLDKISNGK